MSGKVQRQQTIARLIGATPVTNQPQLVELLAGEGIAATQATVSAISKISERSRCACPAAQTVYAIPEFEPERVAPSTSCGG